MLQCLTVECTLFLVERSGVPIETWSNKKAEKNRDGLYPKPITDHHKHPSLAKAGNARKPRWVLPKPITESQQTPKTGDSKKTEMGGAQTHHQITTNTQGWRLKENRDGRCPNPSPNHNKYPRLGTQRKQRWVVLECTWQSQHPLLCLEQRRGWWFQLKKRRRKEVCIKLPFQHKNEEEEEEKNKRGGN